MTERAVLSTAVSDLAGEAGLAKADTAVYPEPAGDRDAVSYFRHLADNLRAVLVQRGVVAGLKAGGSVAKEVVEAEEAQLAHILEVVGRHGYHPAKTAKAAKTAAVSGSEPTEG